MPTSTKPREDANDLEQLLARVALRDQAAFEQLYLRVSPHLMALMMRMFGDRDVAEDALQEAFVQIWQKAGEFRAGLAAPMTWMTSIARYRALDRLRRDKGDRTLSSEDVSLVEQGSLLAEPLLALAESTDGQALKDCMGDLSESQRMAIALAFYKGLTHEELTRHLDSPLGTIKSWIRRGLEKLRRCLGTMGMDAFDGAEREGA